MDSETKQEYQTDKSEFNMGLAILKRVDNLLTASTLYSQQRELHKWYDSLLSLMKEIEYMFNKEESKINKEYQKRINAIDQDYELYRSKNKSLKFKRFGYLYELLVSYEKFLRKSFLNRDMLIKYKDDPGDAVSEEDD